MLFTDSTVLSIASIYYQISDLVMEAQCQGIRVVIAGDFNLSLSTGARGMIMEDFCDEFKFKNW